jgi:hypothetical protein
MATSDLESPHVEGAENWRIRVRLPVPLLAAAAAAGAAVIQGALLPWVAVSLQQKAQPDTHLLTARFFGACASNAACIHACNTLAFAVLAACLAWVVSYKSTSGLKAAAVGAGIGIACSPFAPALLVHRFGAESFLTLILFALVVSDAAHIFELPLPLKCVVLACLVLQNPTFSISSLAYAALYAAQSRPVHRALWLFGSIIGALLLSAFFAGTGMWFTADYRAGAGATLIAIAFLAFIAGPIVVASSRDGIPSRLGVSERCRGVFVIAIAALAQGLLSSSPSASEYWLAAEIAFLAGALFSVAEGSHAATAVTAGMAALIVVQAAGLAHRRPVLGIAGLPRNDQTISMALAAAGGESRQVCVSAENDAAIRPRALNTLYGRITFADTPYDCLRSTPASSGIVTQDPSGATDWGTGGRALLQAVAAARNASALHGPIAPAADAGRRGAFSTAIQTPAGKVLTFIAQSGSSYRVPCAWRGTHRHLTFAAGNPLQAYPGAGTVQYTVFAIVGHHEHVLVEQSIDPHAGPVSWAYHDIALPAASGDCGRLQFTSTALGAGIATWTAFVAPAVH